MELIPLLLLIIICVALLAGYPVALTLGGISILFALICIPFGIFDPTIFKSIPIRIFGIMNNVTLLAVPLFIFMGTILEKSGGSYGEAQQALVIRFLEKKGYNVNNPELRPRVVAAAGVVGAEMGHIAPSEIPRLAPGIKVSDTEVDSIITDLKRLAQQFKSPVEEEHHQELDLAESVADASERVNSMRKRIDGVDDLLARLKLSHD